MSMLRVGQIAFSLIILLGATAVLPASANAMQTTRSGHEQEPSWSAAYDINDGGQIVGITHGPERHAFFWNDGEAIALRALPGDGGSHAYGVNNSGQVVGWSGSLSGRIDAVLWQGNETILLEGLNNDHGSTALDINNRGQIVGYSESDDGDWSAVLWENGKATDLGRPPWGSAQPGQRYQSDRPDCWLFRVELG